MSLADAIVLGGCAAVEKAAADAGHAAEVPFASAFGKVMNLDRFEVA